MIYLKAIHAIIIYFIYSHLYIDTYDNYLFSSNAYTNYLY